MEKSLEMRIKSVFHSGNDWERDDTQLDANDYEWRIRETLEKCCNNLLLDVKSQRWSGCHCDEFIFTHADCLDFDSWTSMNHQDKFKWHENNKSSYVVLWVKTSRVAGYYVTHFNHWHSLSVDCNEEPNDEWRKLSEAVFNYLHEHGFQLASRDFLNEQVPFILTWGGNKVADDDPRWEDDDFEPDPVPSVVYDCLFGDE